MYASLGYILRKLGEKTMIQLPPEAVQVCHVYEYSDSDFVGIIQLCCIALALDNATPSAYSLLSEFLKEQDPHSVIELPDMRIMNVTELSNESLKVTEKIISANTVIKDESKKEDEEIELCTVVVENVAAELDVFLPSQQQQVTNFQKNLRNICIADTNNWIPESFIASAAIVIAQEGPEGWTQLHYNDKELDGVQQLLLSQKFPSGSIDEALHTCQLIIKKHQRRTSQESDSSSPQPEFYERAKQYSRALLLSALLYLHLDVPEGEEGRIVTSTCTEPMPLHPQEAAHVLMMPTPEYMQDAKDILQSYLTLLNSQETHYDTLYLYALSKVLRCETRVGSLSTRHVRLPFAPSFALIREVKKLCGSRVTEGEHSWGNYIDEEYLFYDWLDKKSFETSRDSGESEKSNAAGRVKRGHFASDEWQSLQEDDPELSGSVPTMNELMEMTGLEEVKMTVLKLYKRVAVARKRGSNGLSIPLNFRFVGNPGSGKTVTARLLTKILGELKLRPGEDEEAEKTHQRAVENADKAIIEEGKERVKEMQESLTVQRFQLAVDSAKERVAALEESLSVTRNMLSTSNNVEQAVKATHKNLVTNAQRTMKDSEVRMQRRLESAKAALTQAEQQRQTQSEKLTTQKSKTADAKAATASATSAAQASATVDRFIDISGGELSNKGTQHFINILQPLLDAQPPGGVVFIDEAHQLVSSSSPQGRDIVQLLVKYSEDHRHTLSFILAGYEKEMEALIDADPGLLSRFPSINKFDFVDYSIPQLADIFRGMLNKVPVPEGKPQWKLEDDSLADVVGRRIGRGRGKRGFANARAVRNLLDGPIMGRSDDRIEKLMRNKASLSDDDMYTLTEGDVLGQAPDPTKSVHFQTLNRMIGMDSVKDAIRDIMRVLKRVWDADLSAQPCQVPQLNRLFVGPPGTGKTTVAELYGQILSESGFIADGDVVKKIPADFIGSFLGESETKTKKILDSCRGKVLLIDEAYGLARDTEYHRAVLDTIVAEVPPQGGGDMVVIMVGYEDEIDDMIRKANTGLSRRFSTKITFEPYTTDELRRIMKQQCKSENIEMNYEVSMEAAKALSRERKLRNFGNAGAALNFVDKVRSAARARLDNEVGTSIPPCEKTVITMVDLLAVTEQADPFKDLIIPEELKRYIEDLENERAFAAALKQPPPPLKHVVFVGPAGTGKTTAARAMARLLKKAGVLPADRLVELTGESVVGEYIGSTQKVMKEKLNEAVGGVLFVDEAHRLRSAHAGAGAFKEEAMGVLVGAMTAPEYQDNILIVLAGYTDEMDAMLDSDPGLKRRIGRRVEFQNIDPVDAEKILHSKLKQQGFALENACHGESVQGFFRELMCRPGWGNIGDIERLTQLLYSSTSTRLLTESKNMHPDDRAVFLGAWNKEYSREDLIRATQTFLESRPPRRFRRRVHGHSSDNFFHAQGAHSHRKQEEVELEQAMAEMTMVDDETCEDEKDEEDETKRVTNSRRVILDALDVHLRGTLSLEEIDNLMKNGSDDPNWPIIQQKAMDSLKDVGIDNLERQVEESMEASMQAHLESVELCADLESSTNEMERLNQELENSALSAAEMEELERLKALEEEKLRNMVEVCGICYRLNTSTSGCGYRGKSPRPIVIHRDSSVNC